MYFMYSKLQLKKKKRTKGIFKKSKFISLQRSPGFWVSTNMAGFGAIQGKVLTCLWAETWDNPVCRNETGVDQGTSNGVTAKYFCCSLHPWPQRKLPGLQRGLQQKRKHSSSTAGLFVLILHHVLFVALKIHSYFLAYLMGFIWYITILWFSVLPLSDLECILSRCWFPWVTKVSDKGGC